MHSLWYSRHYQRYLVICCFQISQFGDDNCFPPWYEFIYSRNPRTFIFFSPQCFNWKAQTTELSFRNIPFEPSNKPVFMGQPLISMIWLTYNWITPKGAKKNMQTTLLKQRCFSLQISHTMVPNCLSLYWKRSQK